MLIVYSISHTSSHTSALYINVYTCAVEPVLKMSKVHVLFVQIGFVLLLLLLLPRVVKDPSLCVCVMCVIVCGSQTCCRDSTVDSSCSRLDSSSSHLQHRAQGWVTNGWVQSARGH